MRLIIPAFFLLATLLPTTANCQNQDRNENQPKLVNLLAEIDELKSEIQTLKLQAKELELKNAELSRLSSHVANLSIQNALSKLAGPGNRFCRVEFDIWVAEADVQKYTQKIESVGDNLGERFNRVLSTKQVNMLTGEAGRAALERKFHAIATKELGANMILKIRSLAIQ